MKLFNHSFLLFLKGRKSRTRHI